MKSFPVNSIRFTKLVRLRVKTAQHCPSQTETGKDDWDKITETLWWPFSGNFCKMKVALPSANSQLKGDPSDGSLKMFTLFSLAFIMRDYR